MIRRRNKLVPLATLLCFFSDQIQAATLLSFAQRPVCNVIPVGPTKALVPSHCFGKSPTPTYPFISDDGRLVAIEKVATNSDLDYAMVTTRDSFKTYYNIGPVGKGPVSLLSERPDSELFVTRQNTFTPDKSKTVLFHDFKTMGGDSGAPIFQNGNVIGMHLGVSSSEVEHGRGIALLLSQLDEESAVTLASAAPAITYKPQILPALVEAGAWCVANGAVCGAGMVLIGTVVSSTKDIIVAYITQRGGADLLFTKDKLQQCIQEKDAIEEILTNIQDEQKQKSDKIIPYRVDRGQDTIPVSNPGSANAGVDLVTAFKGSSSGGSGILRSSSIKIMEYDLPVHRQSSPGEEAVGSLRYLTAIALVDIFHVQYARDPTQEEYLRGMLVAWSGRSVSDVAYYAVTNSWPSRSHSAPCLNCPHTR